MLFCDRARSFVIYVALAIAVIAAGGYSSYCSHKSFEAQETIVQILETKLTTTAAVNQVLEVDNQSLRTMLRDTREQLAIAKVKISNLEDSLAKLYNEVNKGKGEAKPSGQLPPTGEESKDENLLLLPTN